MASRSFSHTPLKVEKYGNQKHPSVDLVKLIKQTHLYPRELKGEQLQRMSRVRGLMNGDVLRLEM